MGRASHPSSVIPSAHETSLTVSRHYDLTVLTSNLRDFQRIPKLKRYQSS